MILHCIRGSGFRAQGFGFASRVSGFELQLSSFGGKRSARFRVSGFGSRVRVFGFGFRVSGFGFWVSDFGSRDSDFGLPVRHSPRSMRPARAGRGERRALSCLWFQIFRVLSVGFRVSGSLCFLTAVQDIPQRALPTETLVDSGTSQSRSGTSVKSSKVDYPFVAAGCLR